MKAHPVEYTHPDEEKKRWWKSTLARTHPEEKHWWKHTRMKTHPDQSPSCWICTLMKVKNKPWWKPTLAKTCSDEKNWWKHTLMKTTLIKAHTDENDSDKSTHWWKPTLIKNEPLSKPTLLGALWQKTTTPLWKAHPPENPLRRSKS